MAHDCDEVVELLEIPLADAPSGHPGAPGGGLAWLNYLPVLMRILEAFAAGSGSFVTRTPFGRKRIIVENA